jgi:type II secretory pathway component GspD/PulD (secretin)
MNLKCAATRPTLMLSTAALLLAIAPLAQVATAQTPTMDTPPADARSDGQSYQTFYLAYATDRDSLNDIATDMRNVLPRAKFFEVRSQNAISMRGTPDDVALAQKIVADLDRPRKVYRLTYTITDGGQAGSARHYTLIVAPGDKTVFKQGERVPIVVGSSGKDASEGSNVQYMDVGLNIDALLSTSGDALTLRCKVEMSSLDTQTAGARDPDVRQTVLEGTSALEPGKALVLGSLDTPGTTKHQEVEVVAELVR